MGVGITLDPLEMPRVKERLTLRENDLAAGATTHHSKAKHTTAQHSK